MSLLRLMSMSAASQFGEMLQIIFALVSATCIFLPACSYGECDYQYLTEPSVFDGGCSPMGISVKLQCKLRIRIAAVGRMACSEHDILWFHSPTGSEIPTQVEDGMNGYTYNITHSLCPDITSREQQFVCKTSNLTITVLQSHQLGYYWCTCVPQALSDDKNSLPDILPVHSKIGLIREPCQQPVARCIQQEIELYQSTKGDSCADIGLPVPPIDSVQYNCPTTNPHTQTDNNSKTPTTPLDTNTTSATGLVEDESDTTMMYVFILTGLALVIFFVIVIVLLIVIIAVVCKKQRRLAEFSKSATRATTNNVILENSIEPDLHVNNAYDSVIRYSVTTDLEYEEMHRFTESDMKAACYTEGSEQLHTPTDARDACSAEDTDPQTHIYARIADSCA